MLGLTRYQFNLIALLGSIASLIGLVLYLWTASPSSSPSTAVTASGKSSVAVGTMSGGTITTGAHVTPASSTQSASAAQLAASVATSGPCSPGLVVQGSNIAGGISNDCTTGSTKPAEGKK
jgi:hypothetical protein